MTLSDAICRRLVRAARAVRRRAYAPYSRFLVGAAVLDDRGRVFAGANVENASYGLTVCAERTAIFAAVAAGARSIRAVAVVAGPAKPPRRARPPRRAPPPAAPCGACRQVIHEFGPGAEIILAAPTGAGIEVVPMRSILPRAFGPHDLSRPG